MSGVIGWMLPRSTTKDGLYYICAEDLHESLSVLLRKDIDVRTALTGFVIELGKEIQARQEG